MLVHQILNAFAALNFKTSFNLKVKQETRAKVQWDHSLSEPMELKSEDGFYYHVDFDGTQPCLYLLSEFEDHRLRMCIPNIIEKVKTEFVRLHLLTDCTD